MMTVKDYAARMAASPSTIRALCSQGILPCVKIGRGYKIYEQEADNYFRSQMVKPRQGMGFLEEVNRRLAELRRR